MLIKKMTTYQNFVLMFMPKVFNIRHTYRKSSKETRGSYSSFEITIAGLIRVCIGKISKNAGLIRIWVLFEGESFSWTFVIYQSLSFYDVFITGEWNNTKFVD